MTWLQRFAAILGCTLATSAHSGGEQELAKLFHNACAAQFPAFSGSASVAKKAGLKELKDGTFNGMGYILNPAMKLSGGGGTACTVALHDADPVQTGSVLAKMLNSGSMKVEKGSRKGRRTTLLVTINGQPARVFIQPMMRTFTSVTISGR